MAQTSALVGRVTDKKTGEGIIGATVLVTGSTMAVPVSVDGTYALPLAAGFWHFEGNRTKLRQACPSSGTWECGVARCCNTRKSGLNTGLPDNVMPFSYKRNLAVTGRSSLFLTLWSRFSLAPDITSSLRFACCIAGAGRRCYCPNSFYAGRPSAGSSTGVTGATRPRASGTNHLFRRR